MKYISEEWIKNSIATAQQVTNDGAPGGDALVIVLNAMLKHCQEIDTLEVTKLRPMSDVQEGDILVKWIRENGLRGAFYVDGWVYVNGSNYKLEEFQGWVPMPIYEPKKV